jgi:hypothetical protein
MLPCSLLPGKMQHLVRTAIDQNGIAVRYHPVEGKKSAQISSLD